MGTEFPLSTNKLALCHQQPLLFLQCIETASHLAEHPSANWTDEVKAWLSVRSKVQVIWMSSVTIDCVSRHVTRLLGCIDSASDTQSLRQSDV